MARSRSSDSSVEPTKRDRTSIILAPGSRPRLTEQGRVPLSTAIRRALYDSLTLFDLPTPSRAALEADMQRLGVTSQRDYIVWLLVERLQIVRRKASESEAA